MAVSYTSVNTVKQSPRAAHKHKRDFISSIAAVLQRFSCTNSPILVFRLRRALRANRIKLPEQMPVLDR